MDIIQLFNKDALGYSKARPQYPSALFDFIYTLCPDLDRAWDCATGNGQSARSLAQKFALVEATDVSVEQIDHAFKNKGIRYSVQPAEKTLFDDESFDLVTVAQALHWFDYGKFWHEVHRVLKPGGIFAAWAYTWPHVSKEIDHIVQTKLLDVIEKYWAPNNHLAWNGYVDVPFPFVEIKSPRFMMTLQLDLSQFISYLGTWSATQLCIESSGNSFFIQFSKALKEGWGQPEHKQSIEMDFYCRVGRHEI